MCFPGKVLKVLPGLGSSLSMSLLCQLLCLLLPRLLLWQPRPRLTVGVQPCASSCRLYD